MGVLANPDSNQAMVPSKQKRTHAVFCVSSAHRLAPTSKPRFVGEKVKLGELISKAKVERCGDRSFPVYSMTMHDGIVEQSGRFKKTIASRDTSSYKVVKKNQLVVGFPIDEGVIYVQNHDQPGIMSPAYNVWDFDSDRILPAYLEFVLHSPQSMAYYAEKMRGTTARRRTLTGDALKNMPVPVPSIEDQYAVVKSLNCIKSQLAATQQMLDKLDQLVKSRFVEMFGDPALNPKGWSTQNLKALGELKNGINFKSVDNGFEIKCLGVGDFKGRYAIKDMSLVSDVSLSGEPNANQLLQDGDVIFVRSNGNKALVGRCLAIFPGGEKVTFSGFCIRFRNASEELELNYLLNCLKTDSMRKAMTGRGASIQNLSQSLLSKLEVPLPPLALQQDFAAFASQVDKSRFIAQRQIEKLQMLYDSLAQDYFGD